MFKRAWKPRRKTVEKQCFACGGMGLEREMSTVEHGGVLFKKDILNNRKNAHMYAMHICKICEGNGVYEVIE